jgi:hypothetical protein
MTTETTRQKEQFEQMVSKGFLPLKDMVEYGKMENLTDSDIDMVMQVIGNNLKTWVRWLKHAKEHPYKGNE